jgi:ABC-type Fe3+ transport system substrate-binding protein
MHLTEGRNRLLLGEFAFFPGNDYHSLESKAKDPDAPIAYTFFADGTASTKLLYVVPKTARHPAAAMLFSMWMGTPEAEAIWQPPSFYTNVHFGQSELDKEMRASLEESKSKLLSFYDSPETMKWLEWYGTDEGRKYRSALSNAVRQRK